MHQLEMEREIKQALTHRVTYLGATMILMLAVLKISHAKDQLFNTIMTTIAICMYNILKPN